MRSGGERRRLEVQLLQEVELLKGGLIFYLRAQPALICFPFFPFEPDITVISVVFDSPNLLCCTLILAPVRMNEQACLSVWRKMAQTSRIPGFYKRSPAERAQFVAQWAGLTEEEQAVLQQSLSVSAADNMTENVIGVYALPLSIATNFTINGRDYLIPMTIEEPSVIAAVSFAARLIREGGGFTTGSTPPVMVAQVQLLDVPDLDVAVQRIKQAEQTLLATVNALHPTIQRLGGGARAITARILPQTETGPMLIVHIHYDVRDAMGANAVNSAAELLAPQLEALSGGRANLRILTNLTDERLAWARCRVPSASLARPGIEGSLLARRIVEANAFALADPYRAATHNKGIMNGIDAVAIATGNDWRALEAGAHAYAARDGRYRALTQWQTTTNGDLEGYLEMPLAVGIIGGATKVHPTARIAMRILDVAHATDLAEIMIAVGMAQNLAAIRALAGEGIQKGHMRLHARQMATAAGVPEEAVGAVVARMIADGLIRVESARAIWQTMQQTNAGANTSDTSPEIKEA